MWENVLRQLGVFAVGVAALAWLCRTIIVHWLSKDVDRYRAQLQQAHEVELEKLRNDLRLRSIEHEIRFRSIHEKQANALADTYERLYEVHKAVASYVAIVEFEGEPSKSEKLRLVAESYERFRSSFYPRKILFPKATGERVMRTGNKIAEVANLFAEAEKVSG